jgi:hypothetical protein
MRPDVINHLTAASEAGRRSGGADCSASASKLSFSNNGAIFAQVSDMVIGNNDFSKIWIAAGYEIIDNPKALVFELFEHEKSKFFFREPCRNFD